MKVDYFVSRDLESRINHREHSAVEEWMKSESSFHIMRDHPNHLQIIPSGQWGSKLFDYSVKLKWKEIWKEGLRDKLLKERQASSVYHEYFLLR